MLLPVLLALEELLLLLDRLLLLLLLDRLLEDFRLALLEELREVRGLDLSSNPFLLWDLLEG